MTNNPFFNLMLSICNGNRDCAEYVLDWCVNLLRNPSDDDDDDRRPWQPAPSAPDPSPAPAIPELEMV